MLWNWKYKFRFAFYSSPWSAHLGDAVECALARSQWWSNADTPSLSYTQLSLRCCCSWPQLRNSFMLTSHESACCANISMLRASINQPGITPKRVIDPSVHQRITCQSHVFPCQGVDITINGYVWRCSSLPAGGNKITQLGLGKTSWP